MARCEHRYMNPVFAKGDIVTDEKGNHSVKAGAKPVKIECAECGAEVKQ